MDKRGRWALAPAFDVMYSYNPDGAWTSRHQMSLNGKRDAFDRADFRALERTASMKRGRADAILEEVIAAVSRWGEFAEHAQVDPMLADEVARHHRLGLR